MVVDDDIGSLLEYTQDKVVVVDETGEFVWTNAATDRILGFGPDELVGENAFDYIHPEDVSKARAVFERVIGAAEETTETVTYRHRAADGSWVWLESRLSNCTNADIGGYVVSSRDISEQIRTETRLAELTRTVSDVLWMFDSEWAELLFVNPAYEDIYGGSVEDLQSDPTGFLQYVHPDDRSLVTEGMDRLSAGESVNMEYRVNPDQNYGVWVWARGQPVVEDGEVVRVVGFSRDITDRRRRKQQLAVMDNLLRHNLRNTLSVILGHTEMIAKHSGAAIAANVDAIRESGETLVESANKQRRIIDLFVESGRTRRFDVVKAVTDAVQTMRQRYPQVSIDVTAPDSAIARTHREFRLAVVELVENAIECSDAARPSVSVTVRSVPDGVTVVVRDECPPIPEQEIRVLTGEREMADIYHTSGLGLWLVYWVVQLSNGTIAFSREDGTGNTVEISLPA